MAHDGMLRHVVASGARERRGAGEIDPTSGDSNRAKLSSGWTVLQRLLLESPVAATIILIGRYESVPGAPFVAAFVAYPLICRFQLLCVRRPESTIGWRLTAGTTAALLAVDGPQRVACGVFLTARTFTPHPTSASNGRADPPPPTTTARVATRPLH